MIYLASSSLFLNRQYVNGDTQVSRRAHFEELMYHIKFKEVRRTNRPRRAGEESWQLLSRAHHEIVKSIANISMPVEYFFVFEDDVELANDVNPSSE